MEYICHDQILPMDANAEYILELLEDAQDDRHVDLYYPQFSHTDDLELYPVVTDAQPKKVQSMNLMSQMPNINITWR